MLSGRSISVVMVVNPHARKVIGWAMSNSPNTELTR